MILPLAKIRGREKISFCAKIRSTRPDFLGRAGGEAAQPPEHRAAASKQLVPRVSRLQENSPFLVFCVPFLFLFLGTSVLSLIFKALLLLSLRHLKTFTFWAAKRVNSPLVRKEEWPPTCCAA